MSSIDADGSWTMAMVKDAILPNLLNGKFLLYLLHGSQRLDAQSQTLSELDVTSEGELRLQAIFQDGIPPGTYEGEADGYGWKISVSPLSTFKFEKTNLLSAEKMGGLAGEIQFQDCAIEHAIGIKITMTEHHGKSLPAPYKHFFGAAQFPEEGKMILKNQSAAYILQDRTVPTMPTHMDEQHYFDLVTYYLKEESDEEEEQDVEEEEQHVEVKS